MDQYCHKKFFKNISLILKSGFSEVKMFENDVSNSLTILHQIHSVLVFSFVATPYHHIYTS